MAHLTAIDRVPGRCKMSARSQARSQPECAQGRMVIWAAPQRPVVLAVGLRDRQIVDAGDAQPHESVLVELPVFIAMAAIPVATIVVPLVRETHGDAILTKGPHLLDQPV